MERHVISFLPLFLFFKKKILGWESCVWVKGTFFFSGMIFLFFSQGPGSGRIHPKGSWREEK